MDYDSIEQKIDLVAQQYNDILNAHTQTLSEIGLRQAALEDHVGTTLIASINEIKEELRRLSSRLDAMEGRLVIALDGERDEVPPTRL